MKNLLILVSAITGWVSVFTFALLFDIHTGIENSAVGLKICAIFVVIKKYRPTHELVSVNNVLREYNDMKKAIKDPKNIHSDNV